MSTDKRGFSSVEIAAGVAVLGSLLAVGVPAFVRNLHASHLVEATQGLGDVQAGAVAFGRKEHVAPPSAPLTPSQVPRGERAVDPPGAWDHPAWQAVGFRAVPEGAAHRFSFATELQDTTFVARAHGDLDGDGVVSVFEAKVDFAKPAEPKPVPGMYVEAELE